MQVTGAMNVWKRTVGVLNRTTEFTTMFMLAAIVVLVLLQIISRALIGSSFFWTEELSRFLLIWVTFLGAGVAFQYGAHICVESLFNRLPMHLKKYAQIGIALLCIAFFLVLIVKGYELCERTMNQMSPAMQVPMGYVYFIIPISGVLQILNVTDITIRFFKTGVLLKEDN